jgi:hypothetical protein
VLPGVAELTNGPSSNVHPDMRVDNAGNAPVTVAARFFPLGSGTGSAPINIQLAAGEVKAINNVLPTLFGITGGGSVTIDAPSTAALVVTGRTFSRDANGGTFGQFIPGVTAAEGVGFGQRALEVLQLEQSDQYRTNVGLVEVTGNPVKLEVIAQNASKVSARVEIDLAGNEFRQYRIFDQLGITGSSYTGRVSVRVIGGTGRIAAYGSVVDNKTVDPTYVPGQ